MGELRHVLHSQQFDRPFLEALFERAGEHRTRLADPTARPAPDRFLRDRILVNLFWEASTRTRLSFTLAGFHLGMRVESTENAEEFSATVKGGRFEDEIRVVASYRPDAIVIRHKIEGAARRAAAVSRVPIINAGDGAGEHPTQALTDLATILWEKGRLDDLIIAIGGDLAKGRTVRSLVYLIAKCCKGIRFNFVSPYELRLKDDITSYLRERRVPFAETESLPESFAGADVVYWTRVQLERYREEEHDYYEKLAHRYAIGLGELELMPGDAILMHPLPRNDEVKPEVDDNLRAAYFRQAEYGLYVRMALLEWVLEAR